jgi:hypothetical protein
MDPSSDWIYCQFNDANKSKGKSCSVPVLKSLDLPYCNYHRNAIRRMQIATGGGGDDPGEGLKVVKSPKGVPLPFGK